MTLLFADFSAARRGARDPVRRGVGYAHARAADAPVGATAARGVAGLRSEDARAQRILIPVLDSLSSMPAARYVARECVHGERMEVHLLHVRTSLSLRAARWISRRDRTGFQHAGTEKALHPVQDLLDACHVRYTMHFQVGNKAAVIVAMARRLDVDRIVVGAARDNSLVRLIEDPVIERVVDFAPVPVDVVVSKYISRLERVAVPVGIGAALGLLCIRSID